MIDSADLPSNSLIDLGLANWIKEIYNTSHTWCAIAKSMKVILIAPISNKEVILISFILLRLHATTRASLVNRLSGRLEAKINNSFSLLTATVVWVRYFLPPCSLAETQPSC